MSIPNRNTSLSGVPSYPVQIIFDPNDSNPVEYITANGLPTGIILNLSALFDTSGIVTIGPTSSIGGSRLLAHYGASFNASASTNTTAFQNAITDMNNGVFSELIVAQDQYGTAGTFQINDSINLGSMVGKTIRGPAQQTVKIRQTGTNKPIFNINATGFSYNRIQDLDMDWASSQSGSVDAYGIAVTTPGSDNNTAFYNTFANLRIINAYRGIGIDKASGYATLWGNHFVNLTIKDSYMNAIYIHNPSAAGMPETLFEHCYIQNAGVTNAGPAIDIQALEAVFVDLGIEDQQDSCIKITNAKEPVRFIMLHMERITEITVNTRIIDIQSTGPVSVHDFGFTGTANVTGAGDTYFFVPGGGYVHLDNLYSDITNTQGQISIFASGSGNVDFTGIWRQDSGTLQLFPTWDTTAPSLLQSYPGGITGGMFAGGSTSSNGVSVNITRSGVTYAASGSLTGWIIPKGTIDGQDLTIFNTGTGSITFAAAGTSFVQGGVGVSIAASTAKNFKFNQAAGLWFPI